MPADADSLHEMARFPEMNPGPVVRLALNGTVLGANAAASAIFERESLDGECLWDLLPELDEAVRTSLLEGEGTVNQDVHVGDTWLALTLAYEAGSQQIFVYGTDIGARKAVEQELSERARFPEMNPGPVARLQADGTVIRANPAARRVLGQEDIQGASFRELCGGIPDDLWNRVLTSGEPIHHEAAIGSLWLSFTLVHEPEADQVFAYGSDVTELKAAERALAELARFPDMNPGPVRGGETHHESLCSCTCSRGVEHPFLEPRPHHGGRLLGSRGSGPRAGVRYDTRGDLGCDRYDIHRSCRL